MALEQLDSGPGQRVPRTSGGLRPGNAPETQRQAGGDKIVLSFYLSTEQPAAFKVIDIVFWRYRSRKPVRAWYYLVREEVSSWACWMHLIQRPAMMSGAGRCCISQFVPDCGYPS